ncbi:MAG: TIGR03862 family flavoprotein [Shimia sp.]
MSVDILVIGGGPAGLAAAEVASAAGCSVLVADQMPSVGRKFLMAGKSGLNLTKDVEVDDLIAACGSDIAPMLHDFDAPAVRRWAEGLGQEMFTGSTGRVFPTVMKASPLLRAWIVRLTQAGVDLRTRWLWQGLAEGGHHFDTPEGAVTVAPKATVLAMGGASWRRLGSDGAWSDIVASWGTSLAPFAPANVGLAVDWSPYMAEHSGAPIKGVAWLAVDGNGKVVARSRGEAVISAKGLEGGGLYPLIPALRNRARLAVSLFPDLTTEALMKRMPRHTQRGLSKVLRTSLRMDPAKVALVMEAAGRHPMPQSLKDAAMRLKAWPVHFDGLRPMDEAISTAGGLRFGALDDDLMIRAQPGTFAAGEMLDWEAPTGGYLLTGCIATGRWAGAAAVRYVRSGA